MPYKPADYPTLSPYLLVADAQAVIDFAAATFGAVQLRRMDRPDGTVQHAELRIDDSVVMLGQAMEGWPPAPSNLHVYVPDVDATYARALENGASSVQAPAQRDDPDRRAGVIGPGGNTWWISTQVG